MGVVVGLLAVIWVGWKLIVRRDRRRNPGRHLAHVNGCIDKVAFRSAYEDWDTATGSVPERKAS